MNLQIYSHNEAEGRVSKKLLDPILQAIRAEETKVTRGNKARIKRLLLDELTKLGWSDRIMISPSNKITLTAKNGDTGLCLQLGNMARFYADLMKIEYVYKSQKITAAIYILPMKEAAKKLGSNIAHFERFTIELRLFAKIIRTPILVIGFG